ncbi:phage tail sheath protein [Leptotrichia sp. HSP-334]|uniref:Phage tail sheath protein n=1 Tax=Leptotrichia rugosa TaxID=3239302 RepID=A0AB39VHZ8_9FUSO
MAIVGQINASPSISIAFKTLATTAIQRSERGTVCLILQDTKATQKWYTFKTIADVETEKWDKDSIKYINLAMHYGAFKILVRVIQSGEDTSKVLKDLEMRKFNWLAYPKASETEDQTVVNWVKQQFGNTGAIGKTVKYVSSFADKTDHVAIVELANGGTYKSIYGDFAAQEYTVAIAGLIAGMPLNRSADNYTMSDLKSVEDYEPKLGKFSLYNDEEVVKVNYGVNSKTTFDSTWKKDTRKIKVVEGMCFIVDDIRDTFKNYWLGKYINDYDNKMNFCSNITKVYFKEMSPNVLNGDYDNKVEIDIEAHKKVIIADGLEVNSMMDLEILQYPTGEDVYLTGDVRFVDTMASLSLTMAM